MTFADSSVLAASRGQASQLTVFVDRLADPVESGVASDSFVGGVDTDDFVVFVDSILSHPVAERESGKFVCEPLQVI
jgi:hypothetical protein